MLNIILIVRFWCSKFDVSFSLLFSVNLDYIIYFAAKNFCCYFAILKTNVECQHKKALKNIKRQSAKINSLTVLLEIVYWNN